MYKTFFSFDELIKEVQTDRVIEGDGAGNANRFPIRFVLFDNFRDCCAFVEEMSHLPHIAMQRIEDWMDEEYPDTFIPHDNLANRILELIHNTPTEYRIIMPFSEIARFYNNETRKDFDALIATVKGFDTLKEGFNHKQRIYIPIVGQERKMQQFENDSQSFIWYFKNDDRQLDYRLILTNRTTFGVKGLESKYTIANTLTEWLGCWKYPNLKQNIISTSRSVFSHKGFAKPDNAFEFCPCLNSFQFLTKGLKLEIDCIPYKEEDEVYWDTLATKIDLEKGFKFEEFFNEQFGIFNLADYKVFYETWFRNKKPFMRWLLANYYVHKFCDKGYICRVLRLLEGYSDTAFAKGLALTIFGLENPEEYIEERAEGLSFISNNRIELAPEVQNYLVEKIRSVEHDAGIQSASRYISCSSFEERALIIEWYKDGKIKTEDLLQVYPDLYYYLSRTFVSAEDPWVLDYMDKYKEAKVKNTYTDDVSDYIAAKNKNNVEHYKWSSKFSTTRTLLINRQDIQTYIWIDGLGVDWIPYISQIVREHELEGYYLNEVLVARAKLPTRTDINKKDIDLLSGGLVNKIGDIDKVAHNCRPYPRFVIEDLDTVRSMIHKMLVEHPGEKIAIVSDHGISYLSQLRPGYNLKGYKSDHYGRVALAALTGKSSIVADEKYTTENLEDGKTIALCSLRHESLMAKVPEGMGCHGGCTPEEQLVPIMIISPYKSTATWRATFRTFEVEEANPVVEYDIVGLDLTQHPMVEYNGRLYSMRQAGCRFMSERLPLDKNVCKVTLHVGTWTKDDSFTVKMAVQEDDLFAF